MKIFLAFAASMIASITPEFFSLMPAEMAPPLHNGSISPAPQQINSQFVNIPIDQNSVSISIGSNPAKSAPIAMSLLQQRLEDLKHSNPEKVNIILGLISDPEFKDINLDSFENRYDQYHWVLDGLRNGSLQSKNNNNGWCAEAAIPIDAFRQATMPENDVINPGTAWYFQIVRNIPGSEKLYLSTPTRNDTRDMGRYAKLIFQ